VRPKVLLIHTGGTLGMRPSGEPSSLAPGPSLGELLRQVPELETLADLTLDVAFNRDSSTLEPEHCLGLAERVRAKAADHDGVVIVHGTDTMAFTASVLGFLLADLGKPVILTGSQRPLALVRSDARGNLVDAVSLAASGIPEVGIAFGDHWLRGVASDKVSIHRYEAFESPNLPPLAELGVHVQYHPHAGRFPRQVPEGLGPRLESSLAVYTPFPGMPWSKAAPGIRGVLIQAFGAGNLPVERPDLLDVLTDCADRHIPVVITSQCLSGGVDLSLYELGRHALDLGCIPGGRHTRWAALAKLGLALAAGMDVAGVRQAFATSWAGEPV
jgi:L-asparaginase